MVIGILGGGQLAKMSLLEAVRMGFDVAIFEGFHNSPAGRLTHFQFSGEISNRDVLDKFIAISDVITLENEFIDESHLNYIERKGKKVFPSSHTIKLIQDKFVQKSTLQKAGIPVAPFTEITQSDTFLSVAERLGPKFVLKSKKMGYDGYGNHLVESDFDYKEGLEKLLNRKSELYAEKFIPFVKELAIMVAFNKISHVSYPVVETEQENHICKVVIAPANIDQRVSDKATEIAISAIKAVNGIGIFGIEFFLTTEGEILVNEMAPRPHNSGHYTIESCVTSQFENHIRAVLNLPLGSTKMKSDNAVMVNTLGKTKGTGNITNYEEILEDPDIKIHLYGKEECKPGRKMGHITVTGKDPETILYKALKAEEKIKIGINNGK